LCRVDGILTGDKLTEWTGCWEVNVMCCAECMEF